MTLFAIHLAESPPHLPVQLPLLKGGYLVPDGLPVAQDRGASRVAGWLSPPACAGLTFSWLEFLDSQLCGTRAPGVQVLGGLCRYLEPRGRPRIPQAPTGRARLLLLTAAAAVLWQRSPSGLPSWFGCSGCCNASRVGGRAVPRHIQLHHAPPSCTQPALE